MGFYFRKSIKAGPIRFNFSKRGVGASVGVKGLRYGVRPDGQPYVSAGRYGFYYRENLGRGRRSSQSSTASGAQGFAPSGSSRYGTTSIPETSARAKDGLIDLLQYAASGRFLTFAVSLAALAIACFTVLMSPLLGMICCAAAGWLMWFVGRWDVRRRAVFLHFDPNGAPYQTLQNIVTAFNSMTICRRVYLVTSRVRLSSLHEAKRHAGVRSLFDSVPVVLGQGSLPSVETNVPIPTLHARGQTLHFLPDRIVVLDRRGFSEIDYADLEVNTSCRNLVEDSAPADSVVVGKTWLHPNVDGGPDRRFSYNREMPICRYSVISVHSPAATIIEILASNAGVGHAFGKAFYEACDIAKRSRATADGSVAPYLGVLEEHFQSLPNAVTCAILRGRPKLATVGKGAIEFVDRQLVKTAGHGNVIVYRFLQCLAILAAMVILVVTLSFLPALLTW